jgi:uncharacterized membrane protein
MQQRQITYNNVVSSIRKMISMKYFLLLVSASLIFSCNHEKKQPPGKAFTKDTIETKQTESLKRYKGLFVSGKNMLSFRNCDNADINYFVIDSTHQMANLYKTMFMSTPAFPYEYVYVEIKGSAEDSPPEIAAKGFDSIIRVDEILTFEQKNYRNACIPYDFWALGNQPNWSLQVSEKEGILALKDYSNNEVYLFEYFAPKVVNDEVFTYNSNNYANQTSITAIFKKQACGDGVSNNQYQYSVSVLINGKRYTGCAIRGSSGQS